MQPEKRSFKGIFSNAKTDGILWSQSDNLYDGYGVRRISICCKGHGSYRFCAVLICGVIVLLREQSDNDI